MVVAGEWSLGFGELGQGRLPRGRGLWAVGTQDVACHRVRGGLVAAGKALRATFAEPRPSCVGRAEAQLLVLGHRDPVQPHQCVPVCWPHPGLSVRPMGQAAKAHDRHLREQRGQG